MTVQLPTKPQTRAQIDPRQARTFVGGMPKAGKTTLLGDWAPKTTLILDTQHGTDLLVGEHFVNHVGTWQDFVENVGLLVRGGHPFLTIGLDLIDDVWNLAGQHVARRLGIPAASLADYGKGTAEQEAIFRREIGRLVATPLGLWFLSHVDEVEGKKNQPKRMVPKLDKRIQPWVTGLCHFVFLAETTTGRRQLRTTPSAEFEAGSRIPLPSPMPMDARELYKSILAGLKVPQPAQQPTVSNGDAPTRRPKTDVPVPTSAPPTQLAVIPDESDPQEGEIPPPGSLELSFPAGDPVEVLAFLREHGCPCEDPLRSMTEQGALDEACPIAGHGVPWGDDAAHERAAEVFTAPNGAAVAEPEPAEKPPAKPAQPVFADAAQIARLRQASQGLTASRVTPMLDELGVTYSAAAGMWKQVPASIVDGLVQDLEQAERPGRKPIVPVTPPGAVKVLLKLSEGKPRNEVKGAFALLGIDFPRDDPFAHLTEDQVDDLMGALS